MAAINKIISWNCQLLETSTSAGKKAELLQMINEINPVIILLQETGLKPKSNISGHSSLFCRLCRSFIVSIYHDNLCWLQPIS